MKRAIFFSSFFSIHSSGSKFFTSPAMRQSKALASNAVTGPMPLLPTRRLLQTSSVPMPHPQTKPTPVTTTRLLKENILLFEGGAARGLLGCLTVLLDVLDGI